MPEIAAATLREVPVDGVVPRFEVPGWRARHGLVAGITGRGPGPVDYDLGLWSDAPVGEVMSRWRAFQRALPGFDAVILGNQVHGVAVETIGPSRGWIQIDGIDGWVTTARGVLLNRSVRPFSDLDAKQRSLPDANLSRREQCYAAAVEIIEIINAAKERRSCSSS